MGRISAEELHKPTKYRADHGTMTLMPERTTPTMQITMAFESRTPDGKKERRVQPPVFLRAGEFYDQNGEEYDFSNWEGGEDAFIEHLKTTANPDALRDHGFGYLVGEARPPAQNGRAKAGAEEPAPRSGPGNFPPADLEGDPDLIYEILGDLEMDASSIVKVANIPEQRVRMALNALGDRIERVGEGKRGNPYLYRRAMPTE